MTLTLTYNLDLQSPMVMTYAQAKVQSQWSVGSEDRVETNGYGIIKRNVIVMKAVCLCVCVCACPSRHSIYYTDPNLTLGEW